MPAGKRQEAKKGRDYHHSMRFCEVSLYLFDTTGWCMSNTMLSSVVVMKVQRLKSSISIYESSFDLNDDKLRFISYDKLL